MRLGFPFPFPSHTEIRVIWQALMQQREAPPARPASAGDGKPAAGGGDATRAETEAEMAALREAVRQSRVRAAGPRRLCGTAGESPVRARAISESARVSELAAWRGALGSGGPDDSDGG